MSDKLVELITNLYETRQQLSCLRQDYGIKLGDIQVGYESAIENLLELLGLSEQEIDIFWYLSEPVSE